MKTPAIKQWLDITAKAAAKFGIDAMRNQELAYRKHGRLFSNEPLTKADELELGRRICGFQSYRVGECYMNAAKIATRREELKFCEGVAMGLWPVPHGWVVFKGRAIDVTWPTSWGNRNVANERAFSFDEVMARVRENIASSTYWGIEVPTDLLHEHLLKRECYSPIFDQSFLSKPDDVREKLIAMY